MPPATPRVCPPYRSASGCRDRVARDDAVRGEPAAVHLERIARRHDARDRALVERLEIGDPHDPPARVGVGDRERDRRVAHPERLDLVAREHEQHPVVGRQALAEHQAAAALVGPARELHGDPVAAHGEPVHGQLRARHRGRSTIAAREPSTQRGREQECAEELRHRARGLAMKLLWFHLMPYTRPARRLQRSNTRRCGSTSTRALFDRAQRARAVQRVHGRARARGRARLRRHLRERAPPERLRPDAVAEPDRGRPRAPHARRRARA